MEVSHNRFQTLPQTIIGHFPNQRKNNVALMSTTTIRVNYKYILGRVDSQCYERLFKAINGKATYSILSAMQSKSWFWCSASGKVWGSCFHLPRAGSQPFLSTSTRRPMICNASHIWHWMDWYQLNAFYDMFGRFAKSLIV